MAINSQKLLPQSKIGSSTSTVKVGKMIPTLYRGAQDLKPQGDNVGGEIAVVKKQVVSISKIVSDNTLLIKKSQEQDKKESENKKRDEKENRLEGKKDSGLIKALIGTIPQLGFLDAINRFITFTLLGWAFKKIYPYLPQILEFSKNIKPIIQFFETLSINFFKGVVDFIDFGYKAYDKVREFTKNLGGEPFQKAFDDFSKNLNTFINLALVAGMLATGRPSFNKGDPRDKSGKVPNGKPKYEYNTKRDFGGGKYGDTIQGKSSFGKIKGSNLLSGGFKRAPGRLATRVLGRAGSRIARGIFARIPIIGGLIDFALSLAMGEKPGRAAAKAVGSTLGSALGTFIPVPFAGTILGGILGDIVGGALYDTLVTDKPKKMAGGGKVTTRKGKVVGGKVKRSVRRIYSTPKSKQIKTGASVGGEKKLKQLFPEPPKDQINKMMNPYGFLTNTAKRFGEIPVVGSIFNIFGKVLKGDLPTKDDFRIIGSSFNAWINNAITNGILRGNLASAFAEGGVIDIEMQMKRDISGWVEKSVEELVRNKVTEAINELRKNLRMKPISGSVGGQITPVGEDINISGGSSDFWTLVALVSREDGDPQSWADVAQSIYNRLASGAYTGKSIKELITARTQYQPTWDFPRTGQYGIPNPEWLAIKDAQSAAAASGWDISHMNKVAAALLNPTLQKNAKDFVQGRTDFKAQGQGVTGISRTNRSNVFGWHYNYKENKIASVPNFGATASGGAGGPPTGVDAGRISDRPWNTGIKLKTLTTRSGKTFRVAAALSAQFKGFIDELESLGYKIDEIGGYRKAGTGGGPVSDPNPDIDRLRFWHPYGAAIDINPSKNPYGESKHNFPANISQIAARYGLGWGGNFRRTKDAMHFSAAAAEGGNRPTDFFKENGPIFRKRGGPIGEEKVKPLQRQASYDSQDSQILILPIEIIKEVPVQTNNRFPLNRSSKYSSRVPMQ